MDTDETLEVRRRRYAKEDAGILQIENLVRIGGCVWQDDNANGRQDAGEDPVPNAVAVLYQYDPEEETEYYTYELADKGFVSTSSEAQKPGAATPSVAHQFHGTTGNAWLEGNFGPGMDFTRPGQMKIRITGTEKRKGAWKVYGDLNGRIKMETGADGRYEFEVPVVNADAADADDRLYRYRVMLYQPLNDETRIWSDYRTAEGTADSDVIPANAFMDLNRDVLEKANKGLLSNGRIPDGTALRRSPSPTTDRDRTVSRRSEPSSRTALMGGQPNPWNRIQLQDAMSRHRGAKPRRRCELLGEISLLSPG